MGITVNISGLPRKHGAPAVVVNAIGWLDPERISQDPRARRIVIRPRWVEFVIALAPDELPQFLKQYHRELDVLHDADIAQGDLLDTLKHPTYGWIIVAVAHTRPLPEDEFW